MQQVVSSHLVTVQLKLLSNCTEEDTVKDHILQNMYTALLTYWAYQIGSQQNTIQQESTNIKHTWRFPETFYMI